jgi:membrane protease YdiL (CAAX protease family)
LSAIVGLAIAFGWPLLSLIPALSSHQLTDVRGDLLNVGVKWLVVGALCVIAFALQRWRSSELGIRNIGWRDFLAAFAGFSIALGLGAAATVLVAVPSSLSDLGKLASIPLGVRIVVVLTAAICEEFIYRGFSIEELAYLTGKRWMGGVLSLVIFTAAHLRLYGISAALVIPASVGAVLTGLYLWRRNLLSCMLVHALMDGLFLLVLPALMHPK